MGDRMGIGEPRGEATEDGRARRGRNRGVVPPHSKIRRRARSSSNARSSSTARSSQSIWEGGKEKGSGMMNRQSLPDVASGLCSRKCNGLRRGLTPDAEAARERVFHSSERPSSQAARRLSVRGLWPRTEGGWTPLTQGSLATGAGRSNPGLHVGQPRRFREKPEDFLLTFLPTFLLTFLRAFLRMVVRFRAVFAAGDAIGEAPVLGGRGRPYPGDGGALAYPG